MLKRSQEPLKCFLSRAKTALWFAESFGLDLPCISVSEKNTGVVHSIECESSNTPTTPVVEGEEPVGGFDALLQADKDKVEEIFIPSV